MKLINQETFGNDQFAVAFGRSVSGKAVPGAKSGSSYRVAKRQSSPSYLDLEECSSKSMVRILRSHILDYERLEPSQSLSNYDGILRVAKQCALEPSC
jgi:hypothetical protein